MRGGPIGSRGLCRLLSTQPRYGCDNCPPTFKIAMLTFLSFLLALVHTCIYWTRQSLALSTSHSSRVTAPKTQAPINYEMRRLATGHDEGQEEPCGSSPRPSSRRITLSNRAPPIDISLLSGTLSPPTRVSASPGGCLLLKLRPGCSTHGRLSGVEPRAHLKQSTTWTRQRHAENESYYARVRSNRRTCCAQ